MNRYDLAVFDLDGTILDTSEGIMSAAKYAIQEMHYEIPSEEVISTFIGPPIQDSFAKTFGLSGTDLKKMTALFRDRYKDVDLPKARPYPGIYEVFESLLKSGIMPAIATYKREDYALSLLRYFHFDDYTAIMHGADNENRLKKQDIIKICMEEAGIDDCRRVVMIGDTLHDAVGAASLEIDFISVTYGFGFKTEKDIASANSIGYVKIPIQILDFMKNNGA